MVTLKTLPTATKREVFDHIKNHLLTQNKKAVNEIGECMYLAPDGCRCAAGCLITPDEYKPYFENRLWWRLAAEGNVPKEHSDIIEQFQHIHDHSDVDMWETSINRLEEKTF